MRLAGQLRLRATVAFHMHQRRVSGAFDATSGRPLHNISLDRRPIQRPAVLAAIKVIRRVHVQGMSPAR